MLLALQFTAPFVIVSSGETPPAKLQLPPAAALLRARSFAAAVELAAANERLPLTAASQRHVDLAQYPPESTLLPPLPLAVSDKALGIVFSAIVVQVGQPGCSSPCLWPPPCLLSTTRCT